MVAPRHCLQQPQRAPDSRPTKTLDTIENPLPSAQHIFDHWEDGHSIREIVDGGSLLPTEMRQGFIQLVQHDIVHVATAAELVILGNKLHNDPERKERCLREAIVLKAETAQTHISLAELAERRQDHQQACTDYLAAADKLRGMDDAHAVMIIRTALNLGEQRRACLEIYRTFIKPFMSPKNKGMCLLRSLCCKNRTKNLKKRVSAWCKHRNAWATMVPAPLLNNLAAFAKN